LLLAASSSQNERLPAQWPSGESTLIDFAIALLIGVTALLLMLTPLAFVLFGLGEAMGGGGYYHSLSLVQLAVVIVMWVLLIGHWRSARLAASSNREG
jgi:hypothetical protein